MLRKASKEEARFSPIHRIDFRNGGRPSEPRFIVYPVVGYSPRRVGIRRQRSLCVVRCQRLRIAGEVNAFSFITLEGQYGVTVEHALYTDKDEWFFLGEGKAQNFPLLYYGVGPDTPSQPQALVDESTILFRERILHRLAPSLYFGPEFSVDYLTKVNFDFQEGFAPILPRGAEGSLNIGMGLGLVFDTRHNVLNVRDGFFSELAFLHSSPSWGSDYSFTLVQSDTRFFLPVNERDTLAFQVFGEFTFGDVPFNELATLGGESCEATTSVAIEISTSWVVRWSIAGPSLIHSCVAGATVFFATGGVYSDRVLHASKILLQQVERDCAGFFQTRTSTLALTSRSPERARPSISSLAKRFESQPASDTECRFIPLGARGSGSKSSMSCRIRCLFRRGAFIEADAGAKPLRSAWVDGFAKADTVICSLPLRTSSL